MNSPRHSVIGATVMLAGLMLLAGAGCDREENLRASLAVNDPLDCDKKVGEYFDPRARICVTPNDGEIAYRLSQYRYTYEVSNSTTTAIEFQVGLSLPLTPSRYSLLMESLRPSEVTSLELFFLDNEAAGVGLSERLDSVPYADAPAQTLSKALERFSTSGHQQEADQIRDRFERGDYLINYLRVRATPSVAIEWWNEHWDEISVLQPRITDLDRAQVPLRPPASAYSPFLLR